MNTTVKQIKASKRRARIAKFRYKWLKVTAVISAAGASTKRSVTYNAR